MLLKCTQGSVFFFSSRRRHTRQESVSWARRCVQETDLVQFNLQGSRRRARGVRSGDRKLPSDHASNHEEDRPRRQEDPHLRHKVSNRGSSLCFLRPPSRRDLFKLSVASMLFNACSSSFSLLQSSFHFHVSNEEGFTYICMSNSQYSRRVAFGFLAEIKTEFYKKFTPDQRNTAIAYALNNSFGTILKNKINQYNTDPPDKLTKLNKELSETKNIMVENIDKLLEREEKIELLVKKTATMNTMATTIKKQAVAVRRDAYYRSVRLKIIISLIILIVIYLIISTICGGITLVGCTKQRGSETLSADLPREEKKKRGRTLREVFINSGKNENLAVTIIKFFFAYYISNHGQSSLVLLFMQVFPCHQCQRQSSRHLHRRQRCLYARSYPFYGYRFIPDNLTCLLYTSPSPRDQA
eukprot:TRINITY_DN5262_c0_g2_i8.p1 TRINITY_DN5262_c0_g2~~TRINITY_DN5262_c0_g2_i8.p1  ORF type:complete len:412 (+),score=76.54 TRINITY_DN5262_c0_g2_i8:64-1299(+)